MRVGMKLAYFAALALVLTGCATVKVPLFGRPVEVKAPSGQGDSTVKGELLAVGAEQLWILEPTRVREVPFREIEQVRVRLHGLDGKKAWTWTVAGAVLSGAALATACSQVEGDGNCGGVLAVSLIPWAALGGLSASGLEKSSRILVRAPYLEALRPYARYPQGLPEGLDPATLVQKAEKPRPR